MHIDDFNRTPLGRRVDETSFTDINADMGERAAARIKKH
jgi:hypothetical protein